MLRDSFAVPLAHSLQEPPVQPPTSAFIATSPSVANDARHVAKLVAHFEHINAMQSRHASMPLLTARSPLPSATTISSSSPIPLLSTTPSFLSAAFPDSTTVSAPRAQPHDELLSASSPPWRTEHSGDDPTPPRPPLPHLHPCASSPAGWASGLPSQLPNCALPLATDSAAVSAPRAQPHDELLSASSPPWRTEHSGDDPTPSRPAPPLVHPYGISPVGHASELPSTSPIVIRIKIMYTAAEIAHAARRYRVSYSSSVADGYCIRRLSLSRRVCPKPRRTPRLGLKPQPLRSPVPPSSVPSTSPTAFVADSSRASLGSSRASLRSSLASLHLVMNHRAHRACRGSSAPLGILQCIPEDSKLDETTAPSSSLTAFPSPPSLAATAPSSSSHATPSSPLVLGNGETGDEIESDDYSAFEAELDELASADAMVSMHRTARRAARRERTAQRRRRQPTPRPSASSPPRLATHSDDTPTHLKQASPHSPPDATSLLPMHSLPSEPSAPSSNPDVTAPQLVASPVAMKPTRRILSVPLGIPRRSAPPVLPTRRIISVPLGVPRRLTPPSFPTRVTTIPHGTCCFSLPALTSALPAGSCRTRTRSRGRPSALRRRQRRACDPEIANRRAAHLASSVSRTKRCYSISELLRHRPAEPTEEPSPFLTAAPLPCSLPTQPTAARVAVGTVTGTALSLPSLAITSTLSPAAQPFEPRRRNRYFSYSYALSRHLVDTHPVQTEPLQLRYAPSSFSRPLSVSLLPGLQPQAAAPLVARERAGRPPQVC